jgi:hypothetical protein
VKKPSKARDPAGLSEIMTSAEAMEADVLPSAGVSHTERGCPKTAESLPLPPALTRKPVDQKSPAEWAYERVILYLRNFEERLDRDHEVAMGFTGGQTGVLRIEGVGHFDPDIVTFYGTDQDGARVQLIQHVTQLNVLLRAVPKISGDEAPPRRIGFRLVQDLEAAAPDPVTAPA